ITSNVAYVQRGVPAGPTPEQIADAIQKYNWRDSAEKTQEFNDAIVVSTIKTKIKDHMLKNGGMGNYFTSNIEEIADNASSQEREARNALQELFNNYNIDNISTKPVFTNNGDDFMTLKGTFRTPTTPVLPGVSKDNLTEVSKYLSHDVSSVSSKIANYEFYSVETDSVEIEILPDLTLKLSIWRSTPNFVIKFSTKDNKTYYIRFSWYVSLNDSTFFPGLTEFVKTKLLKL
ncbi:MAG: hypothetical protein RSA87_03410, partial [Malacoplasma sp.]